MLHAYVFTIDSVKEAVLVLINETGDTSGYNYATYYNIELAEVKKRVIKVGFPILWGALSFVFLIVGIKKQMKQLRIIALALLGLTILKLFIFDINVSGPGRIIAFLLLGVLILIISFVYQKLNKKHSEEINHKQDEENN